MCALRGRSCNHPPCVLWDDLTLTPHDLSWPLWPLTRFWPLWPLTCFQGCSWQCKSLENDTWQRLDSIRWDDCITPRWHLDLDTLKIEIVRHIQTVNNLINHPFSRTIACSLNDMVPGWHMTQDNKKRHL